MIELTGIHLNHFHKVWYFRCHSLYVLVSNVFYYYNGSGTENNYLWHCQNVRRSKNNRYRSSRALEMIGGRFCGLVPGHVVPSTKVILIERCLPAPLREMCKKEIRYWV